MTRLEPYPNYKESDIPWIERIPAEWVTLHGRHAVRPVRREPRADDGVVTAFRDGQVTLRAHRRTEGFTEAFQEIGYQGVRRGDLTIHGMDGFAGAIGVSEADGKMTPVVHLYRAENGDARYFAHVLRVAARSGYIQSLARGIRERSTAFDRATFRSMILPIPPRPEQQAIADYLDRETAQIDALIGKQERLVGTLRERRAAVVNQASAGFASGLKVVPSENRWWPRLPEDWPVVSLRRVVRSVSDGPHFSPDYVDEDAGGYMFLSARNIKVDRWSLGDAKYVSAEDFVEFSRRVVPEHGDVLYTKGGTTGVARVVDLPMAFQVWVHVAVLKLRKAVVDPYFLAYALNSKACFDQSQLFTRGATNNDLGLTRMINIELPLPPLDEQRRIAAYLDKQTARIDALIAKAERFIEVSKERRSALVTAAVTGQIDVRDRVASGKAQSLTTPADQEAQPA